MSRKTKVRLITSGIIVGGLVLVVIGGAITISVLNQGRDPASAVSRYLTLLEQGKATEATKLVDPGLPNDERILLTDEVLGAADQRIQVVEVKTQYRDDTSATVKATVSIDGERIDHTFTVDAGEKEFLFLDTWELNEPFLAKAYLSGEGIDSVTVGPTEVPLSTDDYQSTRISVYPGVYTVSAVSNEYLTADAQQLRALPSFFVLTAATVHISAEPNEKFEEAVLKQAQDIVAKCVQVPTNLDEECPYQTQDADLVELKLVSPLEGVKDISLTDFTTGNGTIAVRPDATFYNEDPELRESKVYVTGRIEFVDGVPTISDAHVFAAYF